MPLLRIYALTTIVLALKMSANSLVQAFARIPNKAFVNPEDARMFGGGAAPLAEELPMVKRAANAWRNDLENIPIFLFLAFIYAIVGLPTNAFIIYCALFTLARILHTIFYLRAMQPGRTIAYFVGSLVTLALMIHLFVGFVIVGGD
ncbi:MAG TPA: MAPEG family protein [Candidatus Binataceae bacterium]|nr:MAPEG family protein [Candidatus Binataceae bacterium]